MLDPEKLQHYLQLFPTLTGDDLFQLLALARPRKLEVGEFLLREGESSAVLGYVIEGLIRTWHCNEQGEELTLSLSYEDTVVASHDYILYKSPSRFMYQAMEPTSLLVMSYDDIESLMAKHPTFEVLRHYFIMQLLGASVKRLESFILLSPEERYQQWVRDRPGLSQRVPGKYLASLLGITPVSLSRIRSRIARTGR